MAAAPEMGRDLMPRAACRRRFAAALPRLLAALALAAPPVAAETHFVIVEGLGGSRQYAREFREQVEDLRLAARKAVDDDAQVHVLAGREATGERLRKTLAALAGDLSGGDALAVFLIGHGAHDGREYKMNVPGADFTGAQLKGWLDAVPAGRQLVVAATSSSGGAAETLNAERRVVITATKNGREKNAVVFGRYWAEALSAAEADADKNETISALEAYRYAENKVEAHYKDAQRLATEHPRLEGELAGSFVLARLGSAAQAAADPAKSALLAQREAIERKIDELRLRKDDLPEEPYLDALQDLLVELAAIQEKILGGQTPDDGGRP